MRSLVASDDRGDMKLRLSSRYRTYAFCMAVRDYDQWSAAHFPNANMRHTYLGEMAR